MRNLQCKEAQLERQTGYERYKERHTANKRHLWADAVRRFGPRVGGAVPPVETGCFCVTQRRAPLTVHTRPSLRADAAIRTVPLHTVQRTGLCARRRQT